MKKEDVQPLTIEHGVPMPEQPSSGGRPRIYPYHRMEVGDSIVVASQTSAVAAATRYRRCHNPDFHVATRREGDAWRVWRIS